MTRKPENYIFKFGLEKVPLKELDLAQAHLLDRYRKLCGCQDQGTGWSPMCGRKLE